jgi:hypothetical protein
VPFPAAQASPIASLSADAPCTATDGGNGQIVVHTTEPVTCDVHISLMNGDAYTFAVAFQALEQIGCCSGIGGFAASLPERVGVDAGPDPSSLPIVAPGCGATCSTPPGPVQPPADLASAAAALEGRWRTCGGLPIGAAGVEGIEFDAPSVSQLAADGGATLASGNAYYLINTPSGPPIRSTEFGNLLTYDLEVSATASGNVAYLVVHAPPEAGFAGVVYLSSCPLELQIDVGSPPAFLVPFGS